jgi:hypothetical protein
MNAIKGRKTNRLFFRNKAKVLYCNGFNHFVTALENENKPGLVGG